MTSISSTSHGVGVVISRNPTEDGELHQYRVLAHAIVIGEIRALDCAQHSRGSIGGYNLTGNCDTSVSTVADINTLLDIEFLKIVKK